jgi:hypothetical protein
MTEKLDNLIEERKKIQDLLLENAIERRKLENSLHEVHKEMAKENEKEEKNEQRGTKNKNVPT